MMPTSPFADRIRIDALEKVRGLPIYAADVPLKGMLHAVTVPAMIAVGRMTALVVEPALSIPGVIRVLTPDDFPAPPAPSGEQHGPPPPPTLTWDIAYRGQPVALVVASTLEAAIQGAEAIHPVFEEQAFSAVVDSDGMVRDVGVEDISSGDAMSALAGVTTVVDQIYVSPTQHHNPIELLATTAVWQDGKLVIYEGTQRASGLQHDVATILGLDPSLVQVKSGYIGGGFGQRGPTQRQTAIVARAAILLGRPVKLVMPRSQIFHVATYRPLSIHRIRLGADASGRMVAVRHDAEQEQSRLGMDPPPERYHDAPPRVYGMPNYLGV